MANQVFDSPASEITTDFKICCGHSHDNAANIAGKFSGSLYRKKSLKKKNKKKEGHCKIYSMCWSLSSLQILWVDLLLTAALIL